MSNNLSHHQNIRQWMLKYIKRREIGDLLPTETFIAEQFGVSRLTVHKVMSQLQHDGIVQRKKGKGTYVANNSGAITNVGPNSSSSTVIVAVPHWFSYDIWYKASLAEQLGIRAGYNVIPFRLQIAPNMEGLISFASSHENLAGMIMIPPGAELGNHNSNLLHGLKCPVVLMVETELNPKHHRLHTVFKDHVEAGRLLIDHLCELGHTSLGFVQNEPPSLENKQFLNGMKQSLYSYGLKLKDLKRPKTNLEAWGDSMEEGYRQTKLLLKKNFPTALIYCSYPGAHAGLRAIQEAGLSVPEDISVVVNDMYGRFEEYATTPLTSIEVDHAKLVQASLDILEKKTPKTSKIQAIRPRLQPRASSATPV